METKQHDETNARTERHLPFEPILTALRDQGRIWASYGLTVGKLALETHARAMSSLAVTLGTVAETMAPKPERAEGEDAGPQS